MKQSSIVGIDLAKNVFQVAVMNGSGRIVRNKRVSRCNLFAYVMKRCEGVVAREACGRSHYWERRFESEGFEVRVIAGQFVKSFVKSNKNDEVEVREVAISPVESFPRMSSDRLLR